MRRGYTYIEGLMALLILAVSLTALFSLWSVCFTRIQSSGEVNEAGQIARAEIERAKVYGPTNLPTGTYSVSRSQGMWAGCYDPTANSGAGAWVTNGVAYFDITGARVASATSAGARFSVQISTIDSNVITNGTTYSVDIMSRRALTATVRRLPEATILFQSGTNMTVGGV